jgi:hypothetical protein
LWANTSIDPTTISAISAVTTVAMPSTPSAARKLQPTISGGSSEMCISLCLLSENQVAPRYTSRSARETGIERFTMKSRSGSPSHPGIAGISSNRTASPTSPIESMLDPRSIAPLPPKRSENPSTSSRFPTTLPVRDPRTTSVKPSFTASSAMISSGALPNVALRNPPTPGPVWWAACSVASPISQARGIRAAEASANSAVSPMSAP